MALLLLGSVVVGVLVGRYPHFTLPSWSVNAVLYVIVFLVGLDLSKEKIRREILLKVTLSVVATLVGTYVGVTIFSFFSISRELRSWPLLPVLVGTVCPPSSSPTSTAPNSERSPSFRT